MTVLLLQASFVLVGSFANFHFRRLGSKQRRQKFLRAEYLRGNEFEPRSAANRPRFICMYIHPNIK
jgi:hypothetical protein